jgi:hypothetical protein
MSSAAIAQKIEGVDPKIFQQICTLQDPST